MEEMQDYFVKVLDEGEFWDELRHFAVPATFVSYRAEKSESQDSKLGQQKVEAQQEQGCGCWFVLYPNPPFEEDDKDMIQGFVENPSSIPSVAWTEKKCMVQGLAGMLVDFLQIIR
ncbi:hypothetical protein QAD02_023848 [Eretmocerus hayati]|uniref:Uncharacterized protein n=1 Tax=Eretmocerus hayati TaxID=131215 RepID=A0ACC2PY44_9HYME|nr:hypothetical protein QAD02_023848 [Eretmocerus hayati]